jgi:hypothetical protein
MGDPVSGQKMDEDCRSWINYEITTDSLQCKYRQSNVISWICILFPNHSGDQMNRLMAGGDYLEIRCPTNAPIGWWGGWVAGWCF